MKKLICIAFCLSALAATSVWGQQPPVFVSPPMAPSPLRQPLQATAPALTKFSLDFPGGTPSDLVSAIEKATGKPLNAIIPTENADIQLPPLKMNDVIAPQLFSALQSASLKTVTVQQWSSSYSQYQTDYGFRTSDNPVTDTSIWYFFINKPSLPPAISTDATCRFFQLQGYLNHGFTVDDITTAIQTGWKMAGIASPPELNYHKETNLLIAFGKPDDLRTIQNVLDTLPSTSLSEGELSRLEDQVNHLNFQISDLTKTVSALSEKNAGK